MNDDELLHAITVTWDLDEGTGISVRYGEMHPERASHLLRIAAQLVGEHASLLEELDDDEEMILVADVDDDWSDDDDEDDDA